MAVVERAVDVVRLALQHADPVVELLRHAVLLVRLHVALAREGRVVCGDFGDVGVLAGAELRVAVAGLRVGGSRGCGRVGCWRAGAAF